MSPFDIVFDIHVVGIDGRCQFGFVVMFQILTVDSSDHHLEFGPGLHGVEVHKLDELGYGRWRSLKQGPASLLQLYHLFLVGAGVSRIFRMLLHVVIKPLRIGNQQGQKLFYLLAVFVIENA